MWSENMRLNEIVEEFNRFGAVRTILDLALRGVNLFVPVNVLKGIRIEAVNPEFLKCDKPYRGEFLSHARLTELTRDNPQYEITEEFLRQAFAKGDECYGFLDGEVLAAYGWYSNGPTEISIPGMMLHFDPHYIYMYKGFTHKNYRGQRLHAIAMTRALEAYLSKGYQGIVSYVEWNNFSSLKSCYRMGYVDFGNLYLARVFGRYFTGAGRGCGRYQFRLDYRGASSFMEQRLETATPNTQGEHGA
jgi:Acetyltransferase (GNAT) family